MAGHKYTRCILLKVHLLTICSFRNLAIKATFPKLFPEANIEKAVKKSPPCNPTIRAFYKLIKKIIVIGNFSIFKQLHISKTLS